MKITEILKGSRPIFSFEFFPPKTEEGTIQLYDALRGSQEVEAWFHLGDLRSRWRN